MSDIIERAEAVLSGRHSGNSASSVARIYGSIITDLIAALTATRAEVSDRDEALADVRVALKATRAENETLRADAAMWGHVKHIYRGMA